MSKKFDPQIERIDSLFPPQIKASPSTKSAKSPEHTYYLLKLSRKSLTMNFLEVKNPDNKEKSLAPERLSYRDLQDKDLSMQKCCASQKDFLYFSEKALDLVLSPGRVKNVRLKEQLLADQRLKKIKEHRQKESVANHRVCLLKKESSEEREAREKTLAWEELLNKRKNIIFTAPTAPKL